MAGRSIWYIRDENGAAVPVQNYRSREHFDGRRRRSRKEREARRAKRRQRGKR